MRVQNFVSGVVVAAMLAVSSWMPAQAAMVTTEQMVSTQARDAQLAQVQGFLTRTDVRQQLEGWGVAPEMAEQRVAALSQAELDELSRTIDRQPAGGDALAVIGVVFLVLLILQLVGVTNIFNRI
jgi:hypothetical protein